MRSLKKTLTLALVFVMAIGLLSAGAVDFTDADDIQYAEAVEVMVNLGAINGYPDGTFNPDGLVTRAEAAKLVTYAILTPRVAEYLPKGTSSFDDVPANHWAAPYIEYCVSQGIVNGRGNGKFDPNGNVTAFELAKMLLTAAGYGRNNEYVGATWSLNVVTDAIDNGIFTGTKATNYGAPATREEAALYVFNGLTKVDQVKFSKDTESYVLTVDGGQTIGEQKYGLATEADTQNGVDGYVWKSNGKAVSSFIVSENVLKTSMGGKSFDDFVKANKLVAADTVTIYKNGTIQTEEDDINAAKDLVKKLGVIANFIDGNGDGKFSKVSVIEKTVTKLKSNPTVAKDGKVTIPDIATNQEAKNVPGYEALAEGDVVLWYKSGDVYNIEKAESVTGKITAKKSSGAIVFNGKDYYKSGLVAEDLFASVNYNVDTVLYLDNGGYVVLIEDAGEAPAPTYAVLLDSAKITPSGWSKDTYYEAKILLMDGTVEVVRLAKIKTGEDDDGKDILVDLTDEDERKAQYGKFHTYSVNNKGAYELSEVKEGIVEISESATITPNKAKFDGTNIGNANTVFLVPGTTPGSFVVYKGISDVPALNEVKNSKALTVNGIASFVYIAEAKPDVEAVPATVYFVDKGTFVEYPAVGNVPAYREYEAIVDGELTTVKVEKKDGITVKDGLYEVTYTSGIITEIGAAVTDTSGTGVIGAGGGVVLFDDENTFSVCTYNNDTVVFYISTDGAVTEGTAANIRKDDTAQYTVILVPKTDLADVIIIREVD